MNIISFSFNWNNKLDNTAFSSIRLEIPKYVVGKIFKVMLREEDKGLAAVRHITRFKLKNLNDPMALLDTGYGKEETIKLIKTIYKNKKIDFDKQLFLFIVFKYLKDE